MQLVTELVEGGIIRPVVNLVDNRGRRGEANEEMLKLVVSHG